MQASAVTTTDMTCLSRSKKSLSPRGAVLTARGDDTPGKRALYNNLNKNEELALKIDEVVRRVRPNTFRGNLPKENVIKHALLPLLGKDRAEVERIFLIIKAQSEY